MNDIIYQRVEEHVTLFFKHSPSTTLVFHNLSHTQNVVKHAMEIAGHYNISENEKLILFTAAWFHDTGHLIEEPQRHEEAGCFIMRQFMTDKVEDTNTINQIDQCIIATKWPQNPQNLLQQIICDADVYHFGTNEFKENDKRALQEYTLKYGYTNPIRFGKDTIRMLKDHTFYTSYCRANLNGQKELNIINLKREILEMEKQKRRTAQ